MQPELATPTPGSYVTLWNGMPLHCAIEFFSQTAMDFESIDEMNRVGDMLVIISTPVKAELTAAVEITGPPVGDVGRWNIVSVPSQRPMANRLESSQRTS